MSTSRRMELQAWPAAMTIRDHLIRSGGGVLGWVTRSNAISSTTRNCLMSHSRVVESTAPPLFTLDVTSFGACVKLGSPTLLVACGLFGLVKAV